MTQKEFTELTNLPEEQYVTANASYMACDMEKQEWAKHYLEVKDNKLYNNTVEKYYFALEDNKKICDQLKENAELIEHLNSSLKEAAEFIADQAERQHSRTLAIKARDIMGEKEYLIYKLQHDYFLSEMDKKKIAAMVVFTAETVKETEEELNNEEA